MPNVSEYCAAGFPFLWYGNLQEPVRALQEAVHDIIAADLGTCYKWDNATGLTMFSRPDPKKPIITSHLKDCDAVGLFQWLESIDSGGRVVVFAQNFHLQFNNLPYILMDKVQNNYLSFKDSGRTLIVMAPTMDMPAEVKPFFTPLEFDLPTEDQLRAVLNASIKTAGELIGPNFKVPADVDSLVHASKGLTMIEAENTFAYSAITHLTIDSSDIFGMKKQLLKKVGIDLIDPPNTLEDVQGHDLMKELLQQATHPRFRGILITGVPGTGKTMTSFGLAKKLRYACVLAKIGNLMGSHVGESESKARQFFKILRSMPPMLVVLDEFEKGVDGMASSGQTDGGTMSRVGDEVMDFLDNRPPGVIVMGTCNRLDKIAPEIIRRFDAVVFVDVPNKRERTSLLGYYGKVFNVDVSSPPPLVGWTGKEISRLCDWADRRKKGLEDAMQFVKPLIQTAPDQIKAIQEYCRPRCLPASSPDEVEMGNGRQMKVFSKGAS